jgi:hypothetical protein
MKVRKYKMYGQIDILPFVKVTYDKTETERLLKPKQR